MPLISLTGAYLAFSDAPLLDNTDLFIDENERVCLVGRNGAGKSTLLRVLAKEQPLDDGQVVYEQDLVTARLQQDPPRDIEGTIFDFVAQGVAEDAQYITEYHRVSKVIETDLSEKNLNRLAQLQEVLDNRNLWLLDSRIAEVLEKLGLNGEAELS